MKWSWWELVRTLALPFVALGRGLRAFWRELKEFWGDCRKIRRAEKLMLGWLLFVVALDVAVPPTRFLMAVLGLLVLSNALFYGLRGVHLDSYEKMLDESHELTRKALRGWGEECERQKADGAYKLLEN